MQGKLDFKGKGSQDLAGTLLGRRISLAREDRREMLMHGLSWWQMWEEWQNGTKQLQEEKWSRRYLCRHLLRQYRASISSCQHRLVSSEDGRSKGHQAQAMWHEQAVAALRWFQARWKVWSAPCRVYRQMPKQSPSSEGGRDNLCWNLQKGTPHQYGILGGVLITYMVGSKSNYDEWGNTQVIGISNKFICLLLDIISFHKWNLFRY